MEVKKINSGMLSQPTGKRHTSEKSFIEGDIVRSFVRSESSHSAGFDSFPRMERQKPVTASVTEEPGPTKTVGCDPGPTKTLDCEPGTTKTINCDPGTTKTLDCDPGPTKTIGCQSELKPNVTGINKASKAFEKYNPY